MHGRSMRSYREYSGAVRRAVTAVAFVPAPPIFLIFVHAFTTEDSYRIGRCPALRHSGSQ